jgi:hypothetical protein
MCHSTTECRHSRQGTLLEVHALQVLAVLMCLASSHPAAQQPPVSNCADADTRGFLRHTITSVLGLGLNDRSRAARTTRYPCSQHAHGQAAPHEVLHACKTSRQHHGAQSEHQRPSGEERGVPEMCVALLESISAECSEVPGPSRSGRAEGCGYQCAPLQDSSVAGAPQGRCPATHHAGPDDQPWKSSSISADQEIITHAWNVGQCLLLDFLCCIVRLQSSQGLGAIVSRMKKLCQQHVHHNPTSSTAQLISGSGTELCAHAADMGVTRLWTCGAVWVLNVRFPPSTCDVS